MLWVWGGSDEGSYPPGFDQHIFDWCFWNWNGTAIDVFLVPSGWWFGRLGVFSKRSMDFDSHREKSFEWRVPSDSLSTWSTTYPFEARFRKKESFLEEWQRVFVCPLKTVASLYANVYPELGEKTHGCQAIIDRPEHVRDHHGSCHPTKGISKDSVHRYLMGVATSMKPDETTYHELPKPWIIKLLAT